MSLESLDEDEIDALTKAMAFYTLMAENLKKEGKLTTEESNLAFAYNKALLLKLNDLSRSETVSIAAIDDHKNSRKCVRCQVLPMSTASVHVHIRMFFGMYMCEYCIKEIYGELIMLSKGKEIPQTLMDSFIPIAPVPWANKEIIARNKRVLDKTLAL